MGRTLSKNWFKLLLIFFTTFSISLIFGVVTKTWILHNKNEEVSEATGDNIEESPTEETPTIPDFIDLQPTVDSWLASLPQNVDTGIMIYDLDHDAVAAEYQAEVIFESASVYKLLFAYDGYERIDQGEDDGAAYFTTTSDKGNLTLYSCLDLIIRESYNGCADPLRADGARFARAEVLAKTLGMEQTSNAGLYSTPHDLTRLMQHYWTHPTLSEDSWAKIQDSMLNQPATTYNWRQGFPSGFNRALVYDKVGWNYTGSYWSIYNDVSFVVFPEQNRHYIMVILTNGLSTPEPIVTLGSQIENAILENM